jgi:hypothetical protein
LQRLNRLCVYVDFEWFLPKRILYKLTEKLSVWQSAAAFGGQKLQKSETNGGKTFLISTRIGTSCIAFAFSKNV